MKKTFLALSIALCGCFMLSAQTPENNPTSQKSEKTEFSKTRSGRHHRADKCDNVQAKHSRRACDAAELATDRQVCPEAQQCNAAPSGDKQCAQKPCAKAKKECRNGKKNHCGNNDRKDCRKKEKCNPFAGIELTPQQKAQVDKAKEQRKEKMQSARDKMKKEALKANENFKKELKKILTPEQMARYEANTAKQMKGNIKKGKKGYMIPGEVVEGPRPKLDYKADREPKVEVETAE